jgi:hypothetical protein
MHPVLLWGAVKLVGSRRPVGKVGETHFSEADQDKHVDSVEISSCSRAEAVP